MGFLLVVAGLQDQILISKSFYISSVVSYLIFVLVLSRLGSAQILTLCMRIHGRLNKTAVCLVTLPFISVTAQHCFVSQSFNFFEIHRSYRFYFVFSEETDKVYFRKKDEIVNYAEAYVKCRDTLRKV